MQRHPRAAIIVLGAALAAWLVAAPVLARSPQSSAGADPATDADNLTTGRIDPAAGEKQKKRLEDCMAIWDAKTHMTKKQWRRTCASTLQELPEP